MWRLSASVLTLFLMACGNSPSAPNGNLPFTTLAASNVPGSAGPQIHTVARQEAAWSQIWFELWAGRPPALPPVDFSRDMVVLVTGSEICFGGAEVEEIEATAAGPVVRYGDAAPSLCLCAQPELSFHAVRSPRIEGEPRFEARQTPTLCP